MKTFEDLLALTRFGHGRKTGDCLSCLPEDVRRELASLSLARDLEALARKRLAATPR